MRCLNGRASSLRSWRSWRGRSAYR
jgi:hypothetical protein